MAKEKSRSQSTGLTAAASGSQGDKRCGLCGKTTNLIETECCGNWICDDEHEYKLFSFDRNSCSRNHRRFTLCGFHHDEGHEGDWKECPKCREAFDTEDYVYYGTNEYNFEVLADPPQFEPTKCSQCGRTIDRARENHSISGDDYVCQDCAGDKLGDVANLVRSGWYADSSDSDDFEELTFEEVLQQLTQEDEWLPVDAIQAVQETPDLYVDALIRSIEDATAAKIAGEEPSGGTHFLALFLLTELEVQKAWPAILAAISLPGDGSFELFGEAQVGYLGRILAFFLADRVDELEAIVLNREFNEPLRTQAPEVFLYWVRDERMTRQEAVTHLLRLLRIAVDTDDGILAFAVVYELTTLGSPEILPEIREAFERGLIEESLLELDTVECTLDGTDDCFQDALEDCPPTGILDTFEALEHWCIFAPDSMPDEMFDEDYYERAFELLARNNAGPMLQNLDFDVDDMEKSGMWRMQVDDMDMSAPGNIPGSIPGPIRNQGLQVGRNDPCPCGSGKKFKKCCGK
ncbi:MAG: DUF1186 domain-containing protein [Planctomycetales bacterium]|nr:DUF1186 domain-containing protein [Planctomycetales bacterium]